MKRKKKKKPFLVIDGGPWSFPHQIFFFTGNFEFPVISDTNLCPGVRQGGGGHGRGLQGGGPGLALGQDLQEGGHRGVRRNLRQWIRRGARNGTRKRKKKDRKKK